ncbi:MAG: hypothetical protein II488_00900, partial [Firmicutes bacterium]|nr:hypothetical protein [Bacillota bacterium]
LLYIFADPLMSIFGNDFEMKEAAVSMLKAVVFTRYVIIPHTVCGGTMRAMKRSMSVTVATIAGLIGVRQLYLYIISKLCYTPIAVAYCLPVGWGAGSIFVLISYFRFKKKDMEELKLRREQAAAD